MIATITAPDPITKILTHLGLAAHPPPHRAGATAPRIVRAVLNPTASGLEAHLTEPRTGGAPSSISQRSPRAVGDRRNKTPRGVRAITPSSPMLACTPTRKRGST
jgi:hypothetical protein